MNVDNIMADLQRRYALAGHELVPSQDDISAWTSGCVEDEFALYNNIGVEIARGYYERRYSFEFCDAVVNDMHALALAGQMRCPQPPFPPIFHSVFLAFDAGEYHRREDKTDDPIAEYTDPAIAHIVSTSE